MTSPQRDKKKIRRAILWGFLLKAIVLKAIIIAFAVAFFKQHQTTVTPGKIEQRFLGFQEAQHQKNDAGCATPATI